MASVERSEARARARRAMRTGGGRAASAASAASARRTGTTEKNASSGSEPAPGPGEDVRRDASAASEEVPKAPPPKGSSDPTRARTDGPGGPPDAAPDARSSPSSRVAAATTIQRLWRGFVSRVAKKKKLRAVRLIQPRARLWLRRKRARLAATRVRAFLEGIGEGSELVRRLYRLRRACATIQSAFRTAFRTHPDRVSAASARWACYERYVATRRAERAARRAGRVDNARRDALLGGFSVTRAARYEALDRREMIPDAIKAPVVLEFLARRRAVGARDREAHVAALEEWRSRATRDEGLELARRVVRGVGDGDGDGKGKGKGKGGGGERMGARDEAAARPERKARRALMNEEELARAHAEGERRWRNQAKDAAAAVEALFKLKVQE